MTLERFICGQLRFDNITSLRREIPDFLTTRKLERLCIGPPVPRGIAKPIIIYQPIPPKWNTFRDRLSRALRSNQLEDTRPTTSVKVQQSCQCITCRRELYFK